MKKLNPIDEINEFINLCISLRYITSKQTHYEKLNEWSDKVYDFIHKKLKKYGFKNGEKEQNDNAIFWWYLYSLPNRTIYSKHLKTKVENHHSSAFERNEALILMLEDIKSNPDYKLNRLF